MVTPRGREKFICGGGDGQIETEQPPEVLGNRWQWWSPSGLGNGSTGKPVVHSLTRSSIQ